MKREISIVLIFFMFVSLFYGCSNSIDTANDVPKESKTLATEETEVLKPEQYIVTEDNPQINEEGAEIIFSTFDIEEEFKVEVSKTEAPPLNFEEEITEEYRLDVYEFNAPSQDNFIDLIEIRLDYDPSFMDEGADESKSTFAMYFNPTTKEWETVDYRVDTDLKQVVITTSHLSMYGVFTVKNENTRLAYIGRVNSYAKIVTSEMAQEIITEAISKPKSESEKAVNLGMDVTNDWLGLSGFLLTTSNPVYSSEFLSGLSSAFNGLGIAAATVQVAIDFQSGKAVDLYANLTKNIVNIAVSNWGTSALQLSFAGVFAIDYSLTKFMKAAWNGRNEIWYDAYNLHYKDKMALSQRQWYSKFFWIWQDSLEERDPEYLKMKINEAIEANVTAFWEDGDAMLDYQGRIMKTASTGGGGLNEELMKEITDAKRAIIAPSLQPAFQTLGRRISYYLRNEYRKKLEETKRELNQIIQVTIEEVVPEGMSANYAGYTVKFAPLSDQAKETTWTGQLNEKGSARTKFTILGHLQSGQPNTVEFYPPDANIETDEPEKVIEFKITGTELNIKLGDYPPLEAITGLWPGTIYFESVKVPEIQPKAVIEESEDDTDDIESCDGIEIDLETIFQSLKENEGETIPSPINIVQIEENTGYMFFDEEEGDLEEDGKFYFDYQAGQIKFNKTQDGFTMTMNLRAMYVDKEKIRLYGPINLSGMNGELNVSVLFESER